MLEWLAALSFAILAVLIVKLVATESRPDAPAKDKSLCAGETSTVTLICKPSALANYLLKNCRTFSSYAPVVGWTWRTNAFLLSVFEACWPYRSPVQFVRDHLQLSDDGLVALDWAVPCSQRRRRTSSHSTSPVLLIIPNSFGRITRNVMEVTWRDRMS